MKKLSFSSILLFVLVVTDAWLLSHPNIIGQLGVFIYDYSFIASFPKALLTVLLTIGIALGLAYLALQTKSAKLILGLLLLASVLLWISIYFKFSAGTYAMTGKPFIFGNHLLAFMLVLIFGQQFWDVSKNKAS